MFSQKKYARFDFTSCMVILDESASWVEPAARLVHWSETDVPEGYDSIPILVEKEALKLREEYLAWVHDLGEYRLGEHTLRARLRLDETNSFWWMTLIAEKCPMRGSAIFTVLKLRVLEKLYLSSGSQGIVLCSNNRLLHRVISSWCRSMGHPYLWHRYATTRYRHRFREWLNRLPYPMQAISYLVRWLLFRRRYVRRIKAELRDDRQATVITYFPNIDVGLAVAGKFRSHYWEDLHDVLNRGQWSINWVFIYEQSGQNSFPDAVVLRDQCRKGNNRGDRYFFLEEFLGGRAILGALKIYFRMMLCSVRLRSVRMAFRFPDSSLDFWLILRGDWHASLRGATAVDSCLKLKAFEALAQEFPYQEWCLFIWENQLWERALISAWKTYQSGNLIGSQHSTVPPMDFRHFEDWRSYTLSVFPPLLPDILAVNGRASEGCMKEIGFPADRIRKVEALRYMYLNDYSTPLRVTSDEEESKRTLLVLTSYLPDETDAQLRLLQRASESGGLRGYLKVFVKAHPFSQQTLNLPKLSPGLIVVIVEEHLSHLWPKVSAVYTVNTTSAALEAALLGLPVSVQLYGKNLNLSPLACSSGVDFVARSQDLSQSLRARRSPSLDPDYFCLDESLIRWRTLLNDSGL